MEYKYENPLSITSQFSFCGLPFRMDTYAGCAFGCTYCFARDRGGNINSKKLKAADPFKIINKFKNALKNLDYQTGIISEYIKRRVPIHFGGMSDPFQSIENQYKSSLIVLKYLAEINYPIIISTKSTLPSSDEYLNILKSYPNLLIQFSFSTLDDKKSKLIEPNVESPSTLMKTIEILSKNEIKTSIRWQPYIPYFSESPKLFIEKISNIGSIHLGFEHLKLSHEKNMAFNTAIKTITNIDIQQFYKIKNSISDGRELILPTSEKIGIIELVKSEAQKAKMTFGAADNEFQYFSDTNCCCSGVDQINGFENWNKYQIAYAIKKSYNDKSDIKYSLIENEWKPIGAIDKFINSNSRLKNNVEMNKIENYILERWNNLDSSFNPTRYYGVEFNGKYDENNMKIYNWKNF